ncbi:MAG: DNA polymerase III subunit delta [Bacilli bacterium]|nr:DNA polymerase III subunit delta [Bacilli bacterium]
MANIYLYIGEEKYLINHKIERIIKEIKVDEYNIFSYDMDEVNIKEAVRDASTPPFMCENKVVIIKNPKFLTNDKYDIAHDISSFMRYIENPMESTSFIINCSGLKLNEKSEVVKLLRKKAIISETKEISETEFYGWLRRQCDLEGIAIKDDALKLFYNMVGKNMINAKTEVDKLLAYVEAGGTITSKIVNDVVVREIQQDIFALSNSILDHDREKTINTYRDLIAVDNDVNRLFNLVSRTIRDTLLVNLMLEEGAKQNDIATKMGVSPNRAYYLIKNAKTIDIESAKEYIIKLGNLDYKIKSGQVDAKTGFEFFLFQL